MKDRPLVVHIIYRLDFGGLENGVVNLINNMSEEKYHHAIICVSDYTDFRKRVKKSDVEVYALHKKAGHDLGAYYRLWKLLRKLKPDIVHTRNLGTIEYVVPAMLAGVSRRVHGEHGRDMTDIDGSNKKYIFLRRVYALFIHRFIAMSKDLENWLIEVVDISPDKVLQLYNGVDLTRFTERPSITRNEIFDRSLQLDGCYLIGTVGRLQAEKDQATLIEAFTLMLKTDGVKDQKIKLVLVGDGPDKSRLESLVKKNELGGQVLFLGARNDIPDILSNLRVFVLPSKGEGISNTILEAMSSGLPVVATRVGGNPELVEDNVTGVLVPSSNAEKMADAIAMYITDDAKAVKHGVAGRERVQSLFSLDGMIKRYENAYDQLLSR